MNTTYIDWHLHTNFSDGTSDPRTLVAAVKLKGIDSMAITDHDTLKGYFAAKDEAVKWNIELVPGVEISTLHYHILGLHVDPYNQGFQDFLEHVQDIQRKVCEQRITLLQAQGVPINLAKLEHAFPESRLGKYNIFMTMLQDKACAAYLQSRHQNESITGLFAHYFGKQSIAGNVEEKYFIEASEAIEQIHAAGGRAIIAHPFKDVKSMKALDMLLEEGLDGLEVQPNFAEKNIPFIDYAREKGLRVTYGSDFHGPAFSRQLLGRGENYFEDAESFFQEREKYALASAH